MPHLFPGTAPAPAHSPCLWTTDHHNKSRSWEAKDRLCSTPFALGTQSTQASSSQHSRYRSSESISWETIAGGKKEEVFILKEQSILFFAGSQGGESQPGSWKEVQPCAGELSSEREWLKFCIPPEDVSVEPPKKAIFVTQIRRRWGNLECAAALRTSPRSSPPAFPEVTNFPWPVCNWWNDGRSGERHRNLGATQQVIPGNRMWALGDWAEQEHGEFSPFTVVLRPPAASLSVDEEVEDAFTHQEDGQTNLWRLCSQIAGTECSLQPLSCVPRRELVGDLCACTPITVVCVNKS